MTLNCIIALFFFNGCYLSRNTDFFFSGCGADCIVLYDEIRITKSIVIKYLKISLPS